MSLPVPKVEVAFRTDPTVTTPTWEDVTAYAMGFTINRGRQYELDTIQPSTLSLRLKNGDRRFDPTYTLSPYYPYVLPMRQIRVSVTWSAVTYYLFTGYVQQWPLTWDAPTWGSVTVQAVDALAPLSNANVTGTFAQALTGQRISDVLTAASWAASTPATGYWTLGTSLLGTTAKLSYGVPTTVLDTGFTQVQAVTLADSDGATALDQIQAAANAERGVFFVDGQGRAVFQDRHHRFGLSSQVTFADTATSSSRLPYQDLQPDYDVTRILNEVKVTATGGVTQTATDPASIQMFLRRTLSLTPALTADTEAADQASFEVMLHKDAALRFSTLTVKAAGDRSGSSWPYALGLELGQKVTVEHTKGASTLITAQTLSQTCFVEAIAHSVGADLAEWQTTFQLSPASKYDQFFVLGSAALDSTASAVLTY